MESTMHMSRVVFLFLLVVWVVPLFAGLVLAAAYDSRYHKTPPNVIGPTGMLVVYGTLAGLLGMACMALGGSIDSAMAAMREHVPLARALEQSLRIRGLDHPLACLLFLPLFLAATAALWLLRAALDRLDRWARRARCEASPPPAAPVPQHGGSRGEASSAPHGNGMPAE